VHPDNPTLHMGAVRPHPGFVESLLFISPRNGTRAKVFEMLPVFPCISWACVFAGDGAAIFFSALIGLPVGGIKKGVLAQWAGSFGISWCIQFLVILVKCTLHCRRAGFEPQRKSSFRKRVKAHQVLGEAVRARTMIPHFVLLSTLLVVLASSIGGDRLFRNRFAVQTSAQSGSGTSESGW